VFEELLKAVLSLTVILDPFGNVPIITSLFGKAGAKDAKKSINNGVSSAAIILLIFAVCGFQVFALLGVSIASFMIAGGFLLLYLSLEILAGRRGSHLQKGESGIVPLGTPLLAGPGAITTTILLSQTIGLPETIIAVCISILISKVVLDRSFMIQEKIGKNWSNATSRIMALIIAAVAVDFIMKGIGMHLLAWGI